MAADTDDLEPDAALTITRATAVLVVPGTHPWIALRLGPDLLGVPLSRNAARELAATLIAGADAAEREGLSFGRNHLAGENKMGKVDDGFKKFAKAMSDHDAKAVSALYADDAVAYDPFYPEPLRGRQAIEEDAANTLKAFSDLRVEVSNVMEKDDRGAAEYSFKGMNDGALAAPGGDIPATNKKIDMRGGGFITLNQSGLIVEDRRYYDTGQLMQQLGLSGAPPTAAKDAR